MWFSLYSHTPPTLPDKLDTPVHQVALLLDRYGTGELLIYDNQGRVLAEHWASDPARAQCLAADRFGVPLDMWVNVFEIHPLETSQQRRRAQLRHLTRCIAQSCRPVSVIDYALRMGYPPKQMVIDFNKMRDELRQQIPLAKRHAYALPYVERGAALFVSPAALTKLYRALAFTSEAEARGQVAQVVKRVS
jgi:hypothetical protein